MTQDAGQARGLPETDRKVGCPVSDTPTETLLSLRNLRTYFRTENGIAKAVDGVSLDVYPGEVLGIVGESGSGKSVSALSILRLVPNPPGFFAGGEILFRSRRIASGSLAGGDADSTVRDLLKVDYRDLRQIRGRDIGRFVDEAQKKIEENISLPPEHMIKWGGQFELQQRANRRFALIMPITLVLVALLLFTIFYSFQEVLIILINIPLALTGGILALKLFGLYLSVPASIGFIAIFGIALEDGLVLLSAFHHNLKKGLGLREAVIQGVSIKLRPVLMTSFTTIFGVLPLLLARGPGAEIQRPLATVVVGGLFTSTLVTLIVLPLIFQTLKKIKK